MLQSALLISSAIFAGMPIESPQKPAILVHVRGGWQPTYPRAAERDYVVVAVWADGRIVWRSPEEAEAWNGTKWVHRPGKYFAARVPRSAVASALARIHATGVYGIGRHMRYAIPDSSETLIDLREGGRRVTLGSSGGPPESVTGAWTKHWPTFLRSWRAVLSEARALIPKKGSLVRRPDPAKLSKGD